MIQLTHMKNLSVEPMHLSEISDIHYRSLYDGGQSIPVHDRTDGIIVCI